MRVSAKACTSSGGEYVIFMGIPGDRAKQMISQHVADKPAVKCCRLSGIRRKAIQKTLAQLLCQDTLRRYASVAECCSNIDTKVIRAIPPRRFEA